MEASNRIHISAVIKARNERDQIPDCIRSLNDFADEVVVVDDSSTDDTADLARAEGARVVRARSQNGLINVLDRIGFLETRGNWILRIDADERMTPKLAERLADIAADEDWDGVRFARRNIMFGGWARHGGWFVADQLRFFRKRAWDQDEREWELFVHNHPSIVGRVLTLPADPQLATIHHDYESVAQFARRSFAGYAKTEAVLKSDRGANFTIWRLFYAPIRRFLGRFLVRGGFRDGGRGLVLAILLGAYELMVELHLWDLDRHSDRPREE